MFNEPNRKTFSADLYQYPRSIAIIFFFQINKQSPEILLRVRQHIP